MELPTISSTSNPSDCMSWKDFDAEGEAVPRKREKIDQGQRGKANVRGREAEIDLKAGAM